MRAMWGEGGALIASLILGCSGKVAPSDATLSAGTGPGGTDTVERGGSSAGGGGAAVSGADTGGGDSGGADGGGVSGNRGGVSGNRSDVDGGNVSGGSGFETAGSAGSLSTDECSPGLPFFCVTSCAVQNPPTKAPTCDRGRWLCPAGMRSTLECAPDSCALRLQSCCDPVLGNLTSPCGADGRVGPCAAGQIPNISVCEPAGVGTAGCISLEGLPCALENQSCQDGSHVPCNCRATDGGLFWTCFVLPG